MESFLPPGDIEKLADMFQSNTRWPNGSGLFFYLFIKKSPDTYASWNNFSISLKNFRFLGTTWVPHEHYIFQEIFFISCAMFGIRLWLKKCWTFISFFFSPRKMRKENFSFKVNFKAFFNLKSKICLKNKFCGSPIRV